MNLSVLSHAGEPLAPHDLWRAWTFEPLLMAGLILAALVYGWGVRSAWRRAGRGRGITRGAVARFAAGLLALVVALVSPLDALSGSLFSAHMLQHMVLVLVAAPLLVAGDAPLALLWALPRPSARAAGRAAHNRAISRGWRAATSPGAAWLLFAMAIWAWHLPAPYEAALRDEAVHALEHFALLGAAALFWWALLDKSRPARVRYGMAVPYLFTTALHTGVLGALITFASSAWYPYYAPLVGPWGLTPLQDQQLAGLLMWLPGGAVFTGLTIGYFAAWLRALDANHPLERAMASADEEKQ